MKKIILLTILLLLMTSCSSKAPLNLEPKEKITPLTDKFTYELGKCLRDDLYVEYETLNKDDQIKIIEETDDYYLFDEGYVTLAVEKQYVRTEKDPPFEMYEGYTKANSNLYSDYKCTDKINTFKLNDTVKVKDSFLGVLLVEADGAEGYMYPNQVSKTKIQVDVPKPQVQVSTPDSSSGGSGNNDGGGGSYSPPTSDPTPAPDPGPAPSSGDGEDISLYREPIVVLLSSNSSYMGTVLVDDVKTFILVLNRKDTVKVLSSDDTYYTILVDGLCAKVEKKFIRLESEEQYKAWTAYTKGGSVMYSNFDLKYRSINFKVNDTVEVIDEVDGVYVVKTDNGSVGYMIKTNLSEDKIKTVVPKPQVQAPTPDSNSGNSSSSNDGGSESYTPTAPDPVPAPEPEPEWTDPVL